MPDNPLKNLANIKQRSAVMAQGRWYPASELDQMLEDVAEHYKKAAVEKQIAPSPTPLAARHSPNSHAIPDLAANEHALPICRLDH